MTMVKHSVKKIVGNQTVTMVQGIVKAVDKNTDTCQVSPLDGSADFLAVKLEAVDAVGSVRSDVVRYPELNCFCIVGLIDNSALDTFLIKASRYESVVIQVAKSVKITASGNGQVTIDAPSITINGGNNNGLVNITPLVAKINSVEKTLNDFLQAFPGHFHVGVSAGASTSGGTAAIIPKQITPVTKVSDLEDPNITH